MAVSLRSVFAWMSLAWCVGCSTLSVKTEVYEMGTEQVERSMGIVLSGLSACESEIDSHANELTNRLTPVLEQFGEAFASDVPSVRASLIGVLKEVVSEGDAAREALRVEARAVLEEACRSKGCLALALRERSELLRKRYRDHVEGLTRQLRERLTANVRWVRDSVRDFYAMPARTSAEYELLDKSKRQTFWQQKALLEAVEGVKLEHIDEVAPAEDRLRARIDAQCDGILGIFQEVVGPAVTRVERSVGEAEEVTVLPMTDADMSRIITAPPKRWRGIYNRVFGSTAFGNAEIAIRMETAGQFNMKGVVFDPSQVTKATIDGVAGTLSVLAAASGAPNLAQSEAGEQDSDDSSLLTKAKLEARTAANKQAVAQREGHKAKLFSRLLQEAAPLDATNTVEQRDKLVGLLKDYAAQIKK